MTDLDSKHVVVDANVLGIKGHLQLSKLRFLADALRWQQRELWIPEPVLLEWSEHAAGAVLQASKETKESIRLIHDDDQWMARETRPMLIDAASRAVKNTPNIRILPITNAGAKAGIRDQIKSVGAGKRTNGVKTGASDTASVHATHHHEPDESKYIVFSADSDWRTAYKHYSWDAPAFAKSLNDLWTTRPTTATHMALQALQAMTEEIADGLTAISADPWLEARAYPEINASQLLVHSVSIDDLLDVQSDPDDRLIWGTLTFQAVVEGEIQVWEPMTEDWETWTTGYYDTNGSVPLMLVLSDEDGIGVEVDETSVEFYDEEKQPLSMPY